MEKIHVLYGFGIPFFAPEDKFGTSTLSSDIAYEENGRLYQLVNDLEVRVIKQGENKIKDGAIYAASESVSKASTKDLEEYVKYASIRENMWLYYRRNFKDRITLHIMFKLKKQENYN